MNQKSPVPFKREVRSGHPYCMFEEIYSQPEMITETMSSQRKKVEEIALKIVDTEPKRIFFIGCGTSFFAALAGRYAMLNIAGVPSEALPSFELCHYVPAKALKGACVVSISHTGTTKATVEAMSFAKNNGSYTVSITGIPQSPIVDFSDDVIVTPGGRDRAGPMTRSYVTELVALHMLAIQCAKLDPEMADLGRPLEAQLSTVGGIVESFLKENDKKVEVIAEQCYRMSMIFLISGGPNWATALEASLKLKEATRIHSEGFELEEVAHGPRLLLDTESAVTIIEPGGKSLQRSIDIARGLSELAGLTIVVTSEREKELMKITEQKILLPGQIDELLSPILYIVPMQLLTYYMTIKKGFNPDILRQDAEYLRSSQILRTRLQ